MGIFLRFIILTTILTILSASAFAAIWNGGGADNLASTQENWTGSALPYYADDIFFGGASPKDCTWDINNAFSSFTIDGGYAGAVTISSALILSSTFVSPDAPSGLGATAISPTRIDVFWTDNSDTEAGFRIERKTGTDEAYSQIDTVGLNVTSYSDVSLLPATTYYYRVSAYNVGGDSAFSDEAGGTTMASVPSATTEPASNKNGNSATLNATVNPNGLQTSVYLEWGITTSSYDNITPTQILAVGAGNIAVAANITGLSIDTTYHYRVVAINSEGTTYGDDMTFTTPPITITITSLTDGGIIYRPDIMVTGTLVTPGNETGVTVNGKVGMVYNDQFAVNHVPLADGSNTISVTATDTDGNAATTVITVTADTSYPYVTLVGNPESGGAPFTVNFSASTAIPNTAASYSVDFDGNATIDYTGPTFDSVSNLYSSTGIYDVTLTVVDTEAASYLDTIGILVLNGSTLDGFLRDIWNSMKGRLAAQDALGAAGYCSTATKDKYLSIFSTLVSSLPEITSNMQDISLNYISSDVAEYRIIRNEIADGQPTDVMYFIYFVKDEDGLWKIQEF